MSAHRRPSRGLADLRTLTGRSDTQIPAHKAYLRISFLELERARRMQEIRTARARFDIIHARFREIDTEIADILASLNGSAPPARPLEAPRKSAGRTSAGEAEFSDFLLTRWQQAKRIDSRERDQRRVPECLPKNKRPNQQAAVTPEAPAMVAHRLSRVRSAPVGKVSAARGAVREFLSTELGAREIRITKIVPVQPWIAGVVGGSGNSRPQSRGQDAWPAVDARSSRKRTLRGRTRSGPDGQGPTDLVGRKRRVAHGGLLSTVSSTNSSENSSKFASLLLSLESGPHEWVSGEFSMGLYVYAVGKAGEGRTASVARRFRPSSISARSGARFARSSANAR